MRLTFACLAALFVLVGCTQQQPHEPDAGAPESAPPNRAEQANKPDPVAEPRNSLDLSLPQDFFADEEVPAAGAQKPPDFDAGALFDKTDEGRTKVRVTPHLKPGEQPMQLPEVDGGTVSVEKKTK